MALLFKPNPTSLMAFLSLILLCLIPFAMPLIVDDESPSVYDAIKEYDFPVGLLPKGVVGYDLDKATGKFSAYLDGTCSFSLENSYQLRYKSTITGVISKDKLTKLKGVSVKVLLFWINIVEVVRDGEELEFSVGILSANFPVANFEECAQCGCGLDCVNELRTKDFVSSS